MIKCRRLRWAGHVARMEKSRSAFKILPVKILKARLSSSIVAGHVVKMEEGRSAFKILTGKPTEETFREA